jgi:deoxyadenosine/deoxycytidine kinase
MLSKFYSDPVKYAFSFQIMAYTTRLHELKRIVRENPKCKVIICERSLEADKHIFAKMLHDDGLIESVNYQIYESYFAEYEDQFRIDGLVYVKANPETCLERVQKRNRKGETIELDYLKKCHDYHESWFGNTPIQHKTLDVNANLCFDKLDETSLMHAWVNEVKTFVESLKQKNVFSNFGKEVNVYS